MTSFLIAAMILLNAAHASEPDVLGPITLGSVVDTAGLPRTNEGHPYMEAEIAGERGRLILLRCGDRVTSVNFMVAFVRDYWYDYIAPPAIRPAFGGLNAHKAAASALFDRLASALRTAGWRGTEDETKSGGDRRLVLSRDDLTRVLLLTTREYSRVDLVAPPTEPCTTGL